MKQSVIFIPHKCDIHIYKYLVIFLIQGHFNNHQLRMICCSFSCLFLPSSNLLLFLEIKAEVKESSHKKKKCIPGQSKTCNLLHHIVLLPNIAYFLLRCIV